ncbi:MAG TPA: cytochrome b/b6 domain-containing protein [Anaeromyxobacteraceae bacterium]|nr:cytochrome b/b6 domain-containing protein [Anaeromyxobacteraceae bacterium]
MTAAPPPRLVRRYGLAQRVLHWIGVGSFLLLLLSGLALFHPLGALAAGGYSRVLHRLAAVPFAVLPLVYAVLLPAEARALIAESLTYGPRERAWLKRLPAYVMGRTHGLPPQGRLNAGQKLHHAATFFMFATVSGSGAVLWLAKGHLGAAGLAAAAIVHDLSMLGLTVLMVGHVYFTFLYGALPAMWTGWVTEEYARMEHADWTDLR